MKKWYEKTGFIILFLILFFPVGIFLMWKYSKWGSTTKTIVTCCFGILVVYSSLQNDRTSNDTLNDSSAINAMASVETSTFLIETTSDFPAETSETEKAETKDIIEETPPIKTEPQTEEPQTLATQALATEPPAIDVPQTEPVVQETLNPDAQVIVYRTPTGKKYHHENPCGNGTYSACTLEDAKKRGLGPCEKCVLH